MRRAGILPNHDETQIMNKLVIKLFSCLVLLSGCRGENETTQTSAAADTVEVFLLKKEPVSKSLSIPAELHPWERAELYARVEGYVKEVKVDIGDRVKRNQVLAVIDAPEVMANYAKASSDLQAARSRYNTSLDTYKRIVNAAKEKGAVSESEIERTRNQMFTDSANFEAARSGASAYAQLRDYLIIRAAFDGIITGRSVDPGTLVGKGQQPILVLENLSKLRLRVAIPEAYTTGLPENTAINFTVDAQPSVTYSAKLARKSNSIDQKTRTELWEFEVDNTRQELKSGMFANVDLKLQRSENSFVAPYSALVTNLEKKFVIRVRDGKTEWVDIRSGINMNDKVELFGDLQEGDQLVLRANDQLKEGRLIAIKLK
jgi:RND family efflux transporter MFP subunit